MMGPVSTAAREAGGYALLKPKDHERLRRIRCDVGEPTDRPPSFVEEALIEALPGATGYPPTEGILELREAAANWLARRFNVECDPETEVITCLGAKEAIFHLPMILAEAETRPRVVYPTPAYPVYRWSALFAQCRPTPLPLVWDGAYELDLAAVSDEVWRETSVLWLNYPHNPTGAAATESLYRTALDLADRFGFWVVSDEPYIDLYRPDTPPPLSALEVGRKRLLVLNSLSKRSSMANYRTGFFAGDPEAIALLSRSRPGFGVAVPYFIQKAAAKAWLDDEHVAKKRESYSQRWDILRPALEALGLEIFQGICPFYLWCRLPAGEDARELAAWLDREIAVSCVAGDGFATPGYLRFAATPTEADCKEAAERLGTLRGKRPEGAAS